ncbi:MAG: hypothetical protein JWQ21_446 [Herminiimonas sp.]|nr:hypothetical protein [Herminiimonas sp.]
MIFRDMNRLLIVAVLLLAAAGCAHSPSGKSPDAAAPQAHADEAIASFSAGTPGGLPSRWAPLIIHRNKKQTRYRLVTEHGRTILHARAVGASSGLMQRVSIDPIEQPWLNWQWRIGSLIATADNYQRDAEDSPARIILGFDGDKDALPFADQILFETARVITGHDFPYATLMYVWENKAPVGTVIASTRSGRIRMMVAASGPDGIGQWHEFTRNIAEDYEKAFGEKPGRLIGVGVMTDTDNTGETVDAWYGDIRSFSDRRVISNGK